MNTQKSRAKLSDRERIIRDRKAGGGLAPKRRTPEEMELAEQLAVQKDKVLKLTEELEASQAAEKSLNDELTGILETVEAKEKAIQSAQDKLKHERAVIEGERRDNVKFRGDAIRYEKEIEHTFKPALEAQALKLEKERQKRRDEVNKRLEEKAELEEMKAKLKAVTEEYADLTEAADPRNLDVSFLTKDDVEELRKKLTKHVKSLNGNGSE